MKPNHTPKGAALSDLILEIFRVNGRLLVEGDKLMKPLGQTSSRWQVLGGLAKSPQTVPQIARTMGISRQSVQRTADLLVEDELCEWVSNPHHQKSLLLKLTKRGETTLDKISRRQIEWSNDLASRLDKKEIESAVQLLSSLFGKDR